MEEDNILKMREGDNELNSLIFPESIKKKFTKLSKIKNSKDLSDKDIKNIFSAIFSFMENLIYLFANKNYKISKDIKENVVDELTPKFKQFAKEFSDLEDRRLDKNSSEYKKIVNFYLDKFLKDTVGLTFSGFIKEVGDKQESGLDKEKELLKDTKFIDYYNSIKSLVDELYSNKDKVNKLNALLKDNELANEDLLTAFLSIKSIWDKTKVIDRQIKHWTSNTILKVNDAYKHLVGIYEKQIKIVRVIVEIVEGEDLSDYSKVHYDRLSNNIGAVKNSKFKELADIDIVMRNALYHNSAYPNYREKVVTYKDAANTKVRREVYSYGEISKKTKNLLALVIAITLMHQYIQSKQIQEFIKYINLTTNSN